MDHDIISRTRSLPGASANTTPLPKIPDSSHKMGFTSIHLSGSPDDFPNPKELLEMALENFSPGQMANEEDE
jgi:hypothetical protein